MTEQARQAEFDKYRQLYVKGAKDRGRSYGNAHGRIRRVAETLVPLFKHHRIETMLDVGTGRGELLDKMSHVVQVAGCEVVVSLCDQHHGVGSRVHLIPGAHDLSQFEDNSYDAVTSVDVLEHLLEADVDAVLAELKRVAKTMVYMTISHRSSLWGGWELHQTMKPREWWAERLVPVFPFVELKPSVEAHATDVFALVS